MSYKNYFVTYLWRYNIYIFSPYVKCEKSSISLNFALKFKLEFNYEPQELVFQIISYSSSLPNFFYRLMQTPPCIPIDDSCRFHRHFSPFQTNY